MANLITRENVFGAAGKFLELAAAVNDVQAVEHIQAQLAQFRVGLFRIVVVGEVKKGKSSFINALLGDPDLLPTSSDVATSTVYKLMYGTSKKIKVFTRADTEDAAATQAPIEISEDQLKEYGTEDGNPNNKKNVDFIGIQVPHPLLKSGVAIIDRSRMPLIAMFRVRGIGVAVRVRISTSARIALIRSLWRTPKRCSSSTTTSPRSLKATS